MAIIEKMYLMHDIDAFSDMKIVALCDEFGVEAYAIYWIILEHMFPEDTLSLPYNEVTFQALKARTKAQSDIKALVDRAIEFGLFEEEDGQFWSPSLIRRMERLDKDAEEKSEKARKAAHARWKSRRNGKAKKGNTDECSSNAGAMQPQCTCNADAMQPQCEPMRCDANRIEQNRIEQNRTILSCSSTDADEQSQASISVVNKRKAEQQANNRMFDDFWDAYPRKIGKKNARKAWDALRVDDELHDKIIRAVNEHKKSPQWTKDNGQFVPYPATWLRGERWEDSLEHVISVKPREPTPNYDDGEPDFIELLEERRRKEAMNAAQ